MSSIDTSNVVSKDEFMNLLNQEYQTITTKIENKSEIDENYTKARQSGYIPINHTECINKLASMIHGNAVRVIYWEMYHVYYSYYIKRLLTHEPFNIENLVVYELRHIDKNTITNLYNYVFNLSRE